MDYRPHKLFFFLTVRGEKASASSVAFYFNPLDSHVGLLQREVLHFKEGSFLRE